MEIRSIYHIMNSYYFIGKEMTLNECIKKYAEMLRKIYLNESMDISQIPTPRRIQIFDGSNDSKWITRECKNDNDPPKN